MPAPKHVLEQVPGQVLIPIFLLLLLEGGGDCARLLGDGIEALLERDEDPFELLDLIIHLLRVNQQ
jgi:hypothetical protein